MKSTLDRLKDTLRDAMPGVDLEAVTPETNLTDRMTLIGSYLDTDGGKQAVDVMAEAIQSVPEDAVRAAWGAGFSIAADGSLIVPGN